MTVTRSQQYSFLCFSCVYLADNETPHTMYIYIYMWDIIFNIPFYFWGHIYLWEKKECVLYEARVYDVYRLQRLILCFFNLLSRKSTGSSSKRLGRPVLDFNARLRFRKKKAKNQKIGRHLSLMSLWTLGFLFFLLIFFSFLIFFFTLLLLLLHWECSIAA